MTETQTADFTAARILAVAARDAAVRLRDELQRQRPAAKDDDKKIAAAIVDYSDYLICECNAAIGAWTTTGDLQPQPKYDPFADLLGERGEEFDPEEKRTKAFVEAVKYSHFTPDSEPPCECPKCPPQPKCPLSGDPVCPTDKCPPQCEWYEGCGVRGRSDSATAEDAAVAVAEAIAKSLGVRVRVIKL